MTDKIVAFCVIAYIAMSIFTFGHSAASLDGNIDPLGMVMVGAVSASAWPLYWSWELQEKQ